MKQTACPTATGARNIPASPSLLDRARKQAQEAACAVYFLAPFGARVAFPTDSQTGAIWPFESVIEAQEWLIAQGWGGAMEPLGMGSEVAA